MCLGEEIRKKICQNLDTSLIIARDKAFFLCFFFFFFFQ